jgi:hypothetical protein
MKVLFLGGQHDGRWMEVEVDKYPVLTFAKIPPQSAMWHPGDNEAEMCRTTGYEQENYHIQKLNRTTVYTLGSMDYDEIFERLVTWYRPLPRGMEWAK